MEMHIARELIKDQKALDGYQRLADVLGVELVIDYPKPKRYDCTIWLNADADVAYGEFDKKSDAISWAKEELPKHPGAVADLRKWNAARDDFEDWQYKVLDGKFTEVMGFGY